MHEPNDAAAQLSRIERCTDVVRNVCNESQYHNKCVLYVVDIEWIKIEMKWNGACACVLYSAISAIEIVWRHGKGGKGFWFLASLSFSLPVPFYDSVLLLFFGVVVILNGDATE